MKKLLKKYGRQAVALAILSFVFVLPLAAGAAVDTSVMKNNLDTTAQLGGIQSNQTDLPTIIGNFIKIALSLLGVLLVIFILYAGFIWMTANGDTKKVEKAKEILKQAIIGIVIIFAAYAITSFVITQLATL